MPYFLITARPIIDIFGGQDDPVVVVESRSAFQIGRKLGGGRYPMRKRRIEGRQVEGLVWAVQLDSRMLTPFTAHAPGLNGYYQNLIDNEENVKKYRVCLIGATAFVFAPGAKRMLYITQIPSAEI